MIRNDSPDIKKSKEIKTYISPDTLYGTKTSGF